MVQPGTIPEAGGAAGRRAVTARALLLSLALGGAVGWGAAPSPAPARPVITEGLLHYWPNLWDARDEVTGREGVVMAVLPPAAEGAPDATPFHDETGWVQLPVQLRADQAWTVSLWMRPTAPVRAGGVALAFHARDQQWALLETESDFHPRYRWMGRGPRFEDGGALRFSLDTWHHVVLTKTDEGRVTGWCDGVALEPASLTFPAGVEVTWLSVGNDIKGDSQWFGQLRDLCLFDRVLAEEELRALHAAGRSTTPVRNSAVRLAALQGPEGFPWSTNVLHRPVESFTHRRYTAEDGLPQNRIQGVLQTREGYLWVGTEAGVARFDGRRFREFAEHNTPAFAQTGPDVFTFAETEDGTVWAGAHSGLLQIRDTAFTAVTNGLPERFILQLVPAAADALWIAAFRDDRHYRGPCWVRRYHPETGRASAEVVVPGQVRRMVPAADGLWLATEGPELLLFWDTRSAAPTVVARLCGSPPQVAVLGEAERVGGVTLRGWLDPQTPSRWVIEMTVGGEGHRFHWIGPAARSGANASRWGAPRNPDVWLGAEPGLAQIRADRLDLIDFRDFTSPPEVFCLAPNREGGFWLGTAGDGLHLIRERRVEVFTTRDGLSGNDIRSVLATREGSLLAGGPAGLDEYRDGRWTRRGTQAALPAGAVLSIAQAAGGTVWFTRGHAGPDALSALDEDVPVELSLGGLNWHHPGRLVHSPDGRLWVGCERGLTWIESPGRPVAAAAAAWRNQARHGRLAVGAEVPDTVFLKLLPDRDGSLWVGTLGRGLLRVQDQQVERFTTDDGLPADIMVPAHLDESGALWLTTRGAVVRRLRGRFEVLTRQQGIPNDYLLDLVADDLGHYWLPGLRGIHRLTRRELEACLEGRLARVQSLTLGLRDGLLTPECTTLHYPITARTPDGRVWVATRSGVASFDPRQVEGDADPLPAYIEQVVVNHEARALAAVGSSTGPLRLPPGSGRRLELHFTAISLVAADRVRFQHRLEGYDADWSPESDLRLAFYTNLRPGNYRFQVRASNAHGVWNPAATELAFVIAPHLWQRRSVQVTTGLVALLAALLLHRQRVAVLRHLQVLEHQQQLASERARIAADMHDDLGASLTQIAILGELGRRQLPDPVQTGSLLARISQSSRDVAERISDLVWATNPRHDRLDNLAGYVREQAARLLEGTVTRATLRFPERLPEDQVSATFRRNVLLVVKEALHNALKHASPQHVVVEFAVEDGRLHLRIQDDGRGFASAPSPPRGNGLVNMPRRIHDLGGSFELDSAPGRGTRIRCSIPLRQPPSARTA
ncbi:MAG: ATP-binding protein [Verrucomicrobiales bacterium]|nr:ATP-binding protein [Verrucomicrobiales bacterium]